MGDKNIHMLDEFRNHDFVLMDASVSKRSKIDAYLKPERIDWIEQENTKPQENKAKKFSKYIQIV